MDNKENRGALATIGILAIPVICCGVPALAASGGVAVIAGWLSAHGFWLGGGALLVIAAALGGRWWLTRRRCAVPSASAVEPR